MSNYLRPHGLHHTRLSCHSLFPKVSSNSWPLSNDAICLILYHPLLLLPSIFPSIRVFSHELVLHIRWPKCWSFSFRIILPNNIQVDFIYNWLVSSKGHSRVFSSNTIQNHLFYRAQPSFWSSFHIHTSVKFSRSVVSKRLRSHGLQYTRPPYPATTPGAYSNSCPSCQWCLPTVSSSVIPFSSCLQSFPVSGSFPISQFFPSGGQSTGVSASASVFPKNIQDYFPLGLTGWIFLQSKGLSRVFSNTTDQKYQFFGTQLSL